MNGYRPLVVASSLEFLLPFSLALIDMTDIGYIDAHI